MRPFSGSPSSTYGHRPRFYVDVQWVDGWVRYDTDNSLKDISPYTESMGSKGVGASINVTIIDADQELYELMKIVDLHKRPARVYVKMDFADELLLLEGQTEGPISYNWEQRVLTLGIGNVVESYHVGFSAESGQYGNIGPEFANKNWPVCFGSPIFVPMQKLAGTLSTRVSTAFGSADYTLPAKIRYLQSIQAAIETSYAYFSTLLTDLNARVPDLTTTRTNYLNNVITRDSNRQSLEDLRNELEYIQKLVNNYLRIWEAATTEDDENAALAQLETQKALLDDLREEVQTAANNLTTIEQTQTAILQDVKLARYLFSVIDRVRDHLKNLQRRYTDVLDRVTFAQQAQSQQLALYSQPVLVDNGFNFPQGTPVEVMSDDGALFDATFSGNVITQYVAKPTFYNKVVTVADGLASNQFILPTGENIEGHYCLLDSGYIIRIIAQEGTICTYEEKYEQDVIDRTRAYRIQLQTALENGLTEDLNFLLGGGESNAQLEYIANTVPQQVSQDAWNILQGTEQNKQTFTFDDNLSGTVNFIYDGVSSDPFDLDNPSEAKFIQAIQSIPFFSGIEDFDSKFTITSDYDDGVYSYTIQFVYDNWVEADPFPRFMFPFFADINLVSGDGRVGWFRESDGAREYTLREIERILDRAVDATQRTDELNDVKKKIQQTQQALQFTDDPEDRQELQDLLTDNMSKYFDIMREALSDSSVTAQAYRMVSEREERTILDIEVMIYIQWYRSVFARPEAIARETLVIPNTSFSSLVQTSPVFLQSWAANVDDDNLFDFIEKMPTVTAWQLQSNASLHSTSNYQARYIANLLPSNIHAVFGFSNGRLYPVPSSAYTVYGSQDFGQYTATEIAFENLPAEYENDQFFAILTSTVGPNPVSIISWLISNFTNFTPDSSTFTAAQTATANYPCHFFFDGSIDALQLAQQIAYEARCELWVKNNTAYIRYEPSDPTSVKTITVADVREDSLTISYSDTLNLATKFVGSWRPGGHVDTQDIVVRMNVKKYGEIENSHSYLSLTNPDLVYKTLTFWANRYSQTWTYVSFRLDLLYCDLEVNDVVTLDLPNLASPTKAKIISVGIDPNSFEVSVTCWLPILAGETGEYQFFWPAAETDYFPLQSQVDSGNVGHPVNVQVPSGNPWDGLDLSLRPYDTGRRAIGDTEDTAPSNPANQFTEIASIVPSTVESTVDVDNETIEEVSVDFEEIDTPIDSQPPLVVNPGQMVLGRVLSGTATVVSDPNQPLNSDPDPELTPSIRRWEVELMTGERIMAQFPDLHHEDTLPTNYLCMVTFCQILGDYILWAPTEPSYNYQDLIDEGLVDA